MSNSMVSTVLEIEREAENILSQAEQDAAKIIADAQTQRTAASSTAAEEIKKEVANLETTAAADRAKKVKELSATGDASLAAVRNISDAAFDSGVQYIMNALAGK